jgi:hypothetical protein
MPFKTEQPKETSQQLYYCATCGVTVKSCNHGPKKT